MPTERPVSRAGGPALAARKRHATNALQHMRQALSLIDEGQGPADAGAHLDLAIHRLTDWIEAEEARS